MTKTRAATLLIAGIGSRKTPLDVLQNMRVIGERVRATEGWLRSGGAFGADRAFEEGARDRCIVYLPWPQKGEGAKFHSMTKAKCVVFDDAPKAAQDRARKSIDLFHPAPESLDFTGRRLHLRNYFQVMGWYEQPVSAVVCWTPLVDEKPQGGTGQAVRIAKAHDIPIYNMAMERWRDPERILERLGV